MSLFNIKYNKGVTTEDFKGNKKHIIPNSIFNLVKFMSHTIISAPFVIIIIIYKNGLLIRGSARKSLKFCMYLRSDIDVHIVLGLTRGNWHHNAT